MVTPWNYEAELIQSCNCAHGCPCNFNALPTYGNCEALVGHRIRKGVFGSTKLDGVTFVMGYWWPKAIHEGNGIQRLYMDPGANPEQVKALEAIVTGQHGGGVWEIFPKTMAKMLPTKRARIEFHFDGADSWFMVEGVGEVHSEPVRNPVTGDAFEGYVDLPKGIHWKRALVTNIKRWWMGDEDLHARHENRSGFVTVLKTSHTGVL
jgi:hypothetical protein